MNHASVTFDNVKIKKNNIFADLFSVCLNQSLNCSSAMIAYEKKTKFLLICFRIARNETSILKVQ